MSRTILTMEDPKIDISHIKQYVDKLFPVILIKKFRSGYYNRFLGTKQLLFSERCYNVILCDLKIQIENYTDNVQCGVKKFYTYNPNQKRLNDNQVYALPCELDISPAPEAIISNDASIFTGSLINYNFYLQFGYHNQDSCSVESSSENLLYWICYLIYVDNPELRSETDERASIFDGAE